MSAITARSHAAAGVADPDDDIDIAGVVDRIVASRCFSHAPVARRLLRHIAERTLAGDTAGLKEYALGVDVFDRGSDFDTRIDGIVRKHAGRLRARIADYYRGEGSAEPFAISIPKGGYQLVVGADAAATGDERLRPNSLPAAIGPLIGRETDLSEVTRLILANRLVSVVGTGGMGKTRLAIEAVRQAQPTVADTTCFVALDRLSDVALVPEALLTALGLAIDGTRPPLEIIGRQLAQVRALILIDNAEHVLDAVTELVAAVLAAAPGVRIVVTSREGLGIAGEHLYQIPALAMPPEALASATAALTYPAAALLVARAEALGRYRLRESDVPVLGVICRRLDGIPLAIELAAPWLGLLEPAEVAAALAGRIELLARLRRSGLERQRTLHATLDWSYALLTPQEQTLFRQLSVFAGSWTLVAARSVAGSDQQDEASFLRNLFSLVNKSLVLAEPGPGGNRYRLIETSRAYAAELRRADAADPSERRLALHMATVMQAAANSFETMSSSVFLEQHAPEVDNLRAALAWAGGDGGDPPLLAALAGHSVQLFCELGMINEARRWTARALPYLDVVGSPAVAAQVYLAQSFRFATGVAATRETAAAAVAAARRAGDPVLLARALLTLVQPLRFWEPEKAAAAVSESLSLCQLSGHSKTLGFALAAKALSASLTGDHVKAAADSAMAITLMQRFDYRFGLPWALVLACEVAVLAGNLDAAIGAAREAFDDASDHGILAMTGMAAGSLAACFALANDAAESRFWAVRALRDADDTKETVIAVSVLETLGLVGMPDAPRDAARLAGFVEAARRTLFAQRRPSEIKVHRALAAGLADRLQPDELASLATSGATLSLTAACALAQPS